MKSDDRTARATSSLGAWAADWGNSFSILLILWALCYLGLMSFVREATWSHVLKAVSFLPMNAGATVLALRASRRTDTDPRIRRALFLLGLAFGCVLLGNSVAFYEKFVRENNPLTAWTNVLYFGLYGLGLAALLSFPLARRAHNEYRKFLLDAGTVVVAGGLADLVPRHRPIEPARARRHSGARSGRWRIRSVPCCCSSASSRRSCAGRSSANAAASNVLLAGMVLYLVSDLANDLTILENGWGGVSYTDVTYMVAYVLIACALARYFWRPPTVVDEQDADSRSQPFTYLPYISVAICYALLGVVAVRRWPEPMSVLAVGGIVITSLVVIRQIAAVRENVRLLSEQSKRENEARFEALVQHSPDVITIVDADRVIRYVSPTVTQIFGHSRTSSRGSASRSSCTRTTCRARSASSSPCCRAAPSRRRPSGACGTTTAAGAMSR